MSTSSEGGQNPTKREDSITVRGRAYVSHNFLPPAFLLEEYKEINPALPNLIVEEWRLEAQKRREREEKRLELRAMELQISKDAISAAKKNELLRIWIAAGMYAAAFGVAIWLFLLGKLEYGVICAAIPVAGSIITAFISRSSK